MNRSLIIIFLTILFFSIQGKAQNDFRPGYYITNEYDTISGLIDYRGEIRNSKVCVFKQDEKAKSIEFQPFEIMAYRFLETKFYVSKMIPGTVEGEEDKPIFLEYLVNGIANLFFYRDNYGPHYLIENEGEQFVELTNDEKTVYVNNKKYLQPTNRHIGLLRATFADCEEIYPDINRVKLEHESLIELTKNYHEYVCEDGEECIIYEKKLPAVRLYISPIIGLNLSNLKFKNPNSVYLGMDFDISLNWAVGLSLNVTMPRLNEKISFIYTALLENNYFYSNSVTTVSDVSSYNEVHTSFFSLKNSFLFNYTYPKGKIRPTVNVGALLYIIFDQENERISEVADPSVVNTYIYHETLYNATNGGFTVGAGINYYIPRRKILFFLLSFDFVTGLKLKEGEEQLKETYNITTLSLKTGIYF